MLTLIDHGKVYYDAAAGRSIPKYPGNRHYEEILKLQAEGQVLIVPAPPDAPPAQTVNLVALADLLVAKGLVTQEEIDGAL